MAMGARRQSWRLDRRWCLTGVCMALVCLAGCGHATAAKTSGAHATATPTRNLKGSTTPIVSGAPIPPYTFPRQWQLANAPHAPIYSYAFMPTSPLVGFVCTASQQAPNTTELYVTHNGGVTWDLLVNAPYSNPTLQSAGCAILPDQTDSNDVFVTVDDASAPGDTHGVARLYRSQDGGVHWQKLALVLPGTWYDPHTLAVSGSRILVTVTPGGEQNTLANYLYASDDDGQTWKSVAPSLNGKALQVGMELSAMGGALFISSNAYQSGPSAARPGFKQQDILGAPGSSGTPAPVTYWKTSDGGVTWTQIQLPGDVPIFTRSDSGYYGLSLNVPRDTYGNYTGGPITPYASGDGGASWSALPTFAGVEQGYLDPTQLGGDGGIAVTPDGEVIAAARHTTSTGSSDAGLFVIRIGDANAAWQPLAASESARSLQAVVQNGHVVLWGLLINDIGNGTLASLTLS